MLQKDNVVKELFKLIAIIDQDRDVEDTIAEDYVRQKMNMALTCGIGLHPNLKPVAEMYYNEHEKVRINK